MLSAIVKNGRIVLDEPTDLPDGTIVQLDVYSPGQFASDVLDFLPQALQPTIATLLELSRAVREGDTGRAALHRDRLVSDLGDEARAHISHPDDFPAAYQNLLDLPAEAIRSQDIVALELALFGDCLPSS